MAIVQFVFSSFWIWVGTTILAFGILGRVGAIIMAIRKQEQNKEIQITVYEDQTGIIRVQGLDQDGCERVIIAAVNSVESHLEETSGSDKPREDNT